MRDITPMTDEEIEEYRHESDEDSWYSRNTLLRLIATIDALKAQLSSYCEQMCTLQDELAASAEKAEAEREEP